MRYIPEPIDTENVTIDNKLLEIVEILAKNTHENWAKERMKNGWKYGRKRNDRQKRHPNLVPYEELPETEKEFDRRTSLEALKVTKLLGYDIIKVNEPS
jgi:hypothetical protein